jgi:hypothetical protein
MCDFEDVEIISRYTRQQAVDDGILTEILRWNGYPVIATTHVYNELGVEELIKVWHKFLYWKNKEEQLLPEEDRLFYTKVDDKKVWVIEDADSYTVMFPEDY